MTLFQVTYTIPGRGAVTSRGHTREGVRGLMGAVLNAGGSGAVIEQSNHRTTGE